MCFPSRIARKNLELDDVRDQRRQEKVAFLTEKPVAGPNIEAISTGTVESAGLVKVNRKLDGANHRFSVGTGDSTHNPTQEPTIRNDDSVVPVVGLRIGRPLCMVQNGIGHAKALTMFIVVR